MLFFIYKNLITITIRQLIPFTRFPNTSMTFPCFTVTLYCFLAVILMRSAPAAPPWFEASLCVALFVAGGEMVPCRPEGRGPGWASTSPTVWAASLPSLSIQRDAALAPGSSPVPGLSRAPGCVPVLKPGTSWPGDYHGSESARRPWRSQRRGGRQGGGGRRAPRGRRKRPRCWGCCIIRTWWARWAEVESRGLKLVLIRHPSTPCPSLGIMGCRLLASNESCTLAGAGLPGTGQKLASKGRTLASFIVSCIRIRPRRGICGQI